MLQLKIADAQFEAGGRFFGQPKNRVNIPLHNTEKEGEKYVEVTNIATTLEDWQLRIYNNARTYTPMLNLIQKGVIEVKKDGTPMTAEELLLLMKNFNSDL